MRETDKYKILKITTELLDRHMSLTEADQQSKGVKLEDTLGKIYKVAESALLAHIGTAVVQIKTIEELANCFIDSCHGFGALGMRQDLMQVKLLGKKKHGSEALREAITEGTYEKLSEFPWLVGDNGLTDAKYLSDEAYDNYNYNFIDKSDKNALAFIYLLYFIKENEIEFDLSQSALDFEYNSCLKAIINKNWKDRSLVGYFNADFVYIPEANMEFLGIFSKALKKLLEKGKDYFEVMQIKQLLHSQVVRLYARDKYSTPLEIYAEVEKLIAADKSTVGISHEKIVYAKFAVNKIYDNQGLSYELNTGGLQSLVEMLEALGLSGLQEVNVLMGKIKALEI